MISKTAEYALRSLVVLAAQTRGGMNAGALAERAGVPASYLAKTLQMLVRAGLLSSRRGVGGGFALARPASDITALQVVDAVDPRPPASARSSAEVFATLHNLLDGGAASTRERLAGVTLAQLSTPASGADAT